ATLLTVSLVRSRELVIVHTQPKVPRVPSASLSINHSPTPLIGPERPSGGLRHLRLSMKGPPTALVGFGTALRRFFCRPSMNDPPTALVGFGDVRAQILL